MIIKRRDQQVKPIVPVLRNIMENRKLVIGVLAVLVFSYAGFANNVATLGYKLDADEQEIAVLQKVQANVQLEITAARSLPRVEAAVGSLALVTVPTIEYASVTATAVAVR